MANDVSSDGYQGQANETTGAEEFNSLSFLVNQIMSGKWTITLAQVKGISGGGVGSPPSTVNVQPLVNQVDGQGTATAHGVINNVPVFRMQGGTLAIVVDPVVGDIGLIACASRDISGVVSTKKVANPGSNRSFSPSDALYLGGFLNKAPTQYIQLSTNGITLAVSPTVQIVMNSSGIMFKAGSASFEIDNNGQVKINGLAWDVHTHTILGGVGTQTSIPNN